MSNTKPKKSSAASIPWNIKGIEPETREAVKKAAKKRGEKIGQFANKALHQAAMEAVRPPKKTLPAKPIEEQIEGLIKSAVAAQFEAEQKRKRQESLWRKLLG